MKNYYLGNVRRWVFTEDPTGDQLFPDTSIPVILEKLLIQRNIKTAEEAEAFLNPSLGQLHDPFLLEGMDTAAERILEAIRLNEAILVYGDYDVDGVTATAMLVRFLKSLHARVDFYIPDRVDEGYGISDVAVEYISTHDYDLLITVDCGITARFQVDTIYQECSKAGKRIDVIITDHHQCNIQLMPEALAILDPHIPESAYPFKNLCGAGLALKLIHALGIKLDKPHAYQEFLDLAALATIADVVELKDENRVMVKYGIEKIKKAPCTGIRSLMEGSDIQPGQIDSFRVSFALAPRVNAAGRMGCAKEAVDLFTTDDPALAGKIAASLNQSNIKRQEVQEEIFNSAVEIIDGDPRYKKEKVIVVYGNGWHHGVIGIVASKLVDRYHKPAFVIAVENEKAVGSGRSIPGFNLFHALESLSDILVKFGGHEQAGGLTVMAQDLESFRERINTYADPLITSDMLIPTVPVQLQAEGRDINMGTARLMTKLEPFGCENQIPLFCFKGAVIRSKKAIGNGKHLRIVFDIDGRSIDGVYFNRGTLEKGLFTGDTVDIVFTQEINVWQNTESLQLKIFDMHLQDSALKRNLLLLNSVRQVECLDCDDNWLYNGIIDKVIDPDDIVVNRDILGIIYKYITQTKPKNFTVDDLFVHARIIETSSQKNINCFKLFVAFFVFDELELIDFKLETDGTYSITFSDEVKKVNLEDSEILDWVSRAAQGLG